MKRFIAALMIVAATQTMAVDITLSPLYTAVDLIRSAVGTVVSPFATTAATFAEKEQLEAVRTDALNFLAGAESSEVLEASIKEIRAKSADLNQMSDKQIAGLIVTALQ